MTTADGGRPWRVAPATGSAAGAAAAADFATVAAEHGPMLARIAATYEADVARREELLQEVMLAVWRALPAFRGDASVRTFVARIAHNRCVSHVVRERRSVPLAGAEAAAQVPGDVAGQPQQAAQAEQTWTRLVELVQALPLGPRQVISLALEGFSHAEIATALGISTNNVAVRLNRARDALKELAQP